MRLALLTLIFFATIIHNSYSSAVAEPIDKDEIGKMTDDLAGDEELEVERSKRTPHNHDRYRAMRRRMEMEEDDHHPGHDSDEAFHDHREAAARWSFFQTAPKCKKEGEWCTRPLPCCGEGNGLTCKVVDYVTFPNARCFAPGTYTGLKGDGSGKY